MTARSKPGRTPRLTQHANHHDQHGRPAAEACDADAARCDERAHDTAQAAGAPSVGDPRGARLAAALRANLRRRKASAAKAEASDRVPGDDPDPDSRDA